MASPRPEDWDERPLATLLKRPPRYGINAPAVSLADGTHTYIRITDIDQYGRFAPDPKVGVRHGRAHEHVLDQGELVLARTGASVGKSYLYDPADGELVYAGFLINIQPDPEVLVPEFLAYFVQTKRYWDWVARTSSRSGQPGINALEYGQLLVPMPDLCEQRRIVSILQDADALIDSLERLVEKNEAIKQGLVQNLVHGRTRLS